MRELDVLMTRWLERDWAAASSAERCAFQQLLELQDPVLAEYLLQGDTPADPIQASVVVRIREC